MQSWICTKAPKPVKSDEPDWWMKALMIFAIVVVCCVLIFAVAVFANVAVHLVEHGARRRG